MEKARATGKKSATYNIWKGMRARCEKPDNRNYKNYGGRGIKVCERWKKYANFLADMGIKPEGLSIDRIDNDGDYCLENCRWATTAEQLENRRNTVRVVIDGVEMTLLELSVLSGVSYQTLYQRKVKYKWSDEELTQTPSYLGRKYR